MKIRKEFFPSDLSLECTEKVTEEWMSSAQCEDLSLNHGALDVIILQDYILLESFDSVVAS